MMPKMPPKWHPSRVKLPTPVLLKMRGYSATPPLEGGAKIETPLQ